MLTIQVRHRLTLDDVVDILTYESHCDDETPPSGKVALLEIVRAHLAVFGVSVLPSQRRDRSFGNGLIRKKVFDEVVRLFPDLAAEAKLSPEDPDGG